MLIYLKELYQKQEYRVNIESVVFVKELSISLTVLKRVHLWLLNKEQWREKCIFVSTSRPNEQTGFRVSWKLYLNLCSRKWLRSKRSLVRYLIHLQLWQLKTLFVDSLINFKNSGWKKKNFWKKLCLVWNRVILSVFLVLWFEFFVGIRLKR